MNPVFRWLADVLSETLGPAEREAVCGDLAESRESGAQALVDVLGLVARRQQQLWSHWAPWLTLLGLILPLGMLLSILSRAVAGEGAIYTWLYANNFDWALVRNRGFWYVLGESARHAVVGCLTLSCWSWTAGFVLGWVSQQINLRLNSILLCLVLLFGVFLGSPLYFGYISRMFAPLYTANPNDPVNALVLYRVFFPVMAQAMLVAIPALWALQEAAAVRRMGLALRIVLGTAVIGTLVVMLTQERGLVFLVGRAMYRRPVLWPGRVQLEELGLIAYWPGIYLMAKAVARGLARQRRRDGIAASQC